jgi:hypothetical protein
MTRPLVMPAPGLRLRWTVAVKPGGDPGIHEVLPTLGHFADSRVKLGNDEHRAGS